MALLRRALLIATLVAVLGFLVLPVAVVIPLSFSTARYLSFPPPSFGLGWYRAFFGNEAWTSAALMSLWTSLVSTLFSVLLGVPAAIGLARGRFPGRGLVQALILSPIVAPGIVVAIGLYYVYARFGLIGRPIALILGQTALAVPFVVVNVVSTLSSVDRRLERAALSLGATPWGAFRQVTLPLIRPGIAAGAVFAFVVCFDELLIALFLAGTGAVTLPRRMWEQLNYNLDPTIAAASTLLIALTTALMLGGEYLRRRSARLRSGHSNGS
ncbi:ABC transporter permease [Roseomonas gilardii]|uniref:ABC transporter permease n=1 Tax=Roseomonas gilardii TaxID=257708 RepID=UPI000483B4C3|nr:ABC transporter permease [Roseomonas gilardii]